MVAVQQDGRALKFAAAALQQEKEVVSRLQKPTESGGKEISPFCRALGQNCKVKENCWLCLFFSLGVLAHDFWCSLASVWPKYGRIFLCTVHSRKHSVLQVKSLCRLSVSLVIRFTEMHKTVFACLSEVRPDSP